MAVLTLARLKDYTVPMAIVAIALICHIIAFAQFLLNLPFNLRKFGSSLDSHSSGSPSLLKTLQSRSFALFWSFWGPISESRDKESISQIVSQAYGAIVDIGPGSGHTLKYFDKGSISRVIGVEPNVRLHGMLKEEVKKCGLEGIYEVVGCGIGELDLESLGLDDGAGRGGGIDTIVAIKVFCGVPLPKKVLGTLYRDVLKPGGQFLVYEHVASRDEMTKWVQDLYQMIWPLFTGCNLNRDVEDLLRAAGPWKSVDLERRKGEKGYEVFPHVMGRLVK